jgi:hypothetical protein
MRMHNKSRQAGASLMEVMVAMSISLVVTASMIALMANSLRNTTRIIQMTKLSDDMRVAVQMMSRDVRRSSYNADSVLCYGNELCTSDGTLTAADDVALVGGGCFWFEMDRAEGAGALNGDSTDDAAGGFRRRSIIDEGGTEIGWLEMYTGGTQPTCLEDDESEGWVAITNPDNVNITAFSVDDALSYTQVVANDVHGKKMSQKVRKIRMSMIGQLLTDPTITRSMEDIVSVRNDLIILEDI